MNALVPVESMNRPVLRPAAPDIGLVPASLSEAMKLAEMMATARLVPKDLQKSPADCLMVIQQAVRWQMDPFAVAQECSVIQGKLMHSGKLVAAVVNSRGNLSQRLSFEYKGGGEDRTINVSGQLQGETTPRTVSVVLKNAKTNNRVWQSQPDQQLMYHGVRVWARRHTPELMLGVYSPEEFDEAGSQKFVNPRGIPQRTVRDRRDVVWDENQERAPTGEESQEIGDMRVDHWGKVQGDRLIKAQRDRPGEVATPAAPSSDPPEDGAAGSHYGDAPGIKVAIAEAKSHAEEMLEYSERIAELDQELAQAATQGTKALQAIWKCIDPRDQAVLKAALDKRHKPAAKEADAAFATS
jgi:hypothetical protein